MAHLPDDPDLGWLRKRAKELKREHPEWKLADAQLHLARHYEFPSWPALKRYVELVRSYRRAPDEVPEQERAEDEFLRLACLTYGADDPQRQVRAAAMLRDDPTLGAGDIWVAAARCDVDGAAPAAGADPGLATREGGPFEWAPLAYLAYARHDPDVTEAATLGSARVLLEAGPTPTPATSGTVCRRRSPCSPAASGRARAGRATSRRTRTARPWPALLLEAGADPNDPQTLYNRMFRPDDSHLELLFEFGLGTGDGGPWKRRLGRAAMGPAEMVADQLGWAVMHGMDARVELLVRHGVDPGTRVGGFGGGGRTAYEVASISGHPATAELLLRLGAAEPDLSNEQRVVIAVLNGQPVDAAAVPAAVAARPGLVAWAAHHGNADAVRRAVELGWDVNRRARTDVPSDQEWETGLHAAAGNGDLEMVRLLLELGADPSLKDCRFDAPPVQWAEHFGRTEVVELLNDRSG